jgi:hypothetical protein
MSTQTTPFSGDLVEGLLATVTKLQDHSHFCSACEALITNTCRCRYADEKQICDECDDEIRR